MALRTGHWALLIVLVVAGVYFLLFHQDPFPLNHEAVGLGKGEMHVYHDVIGIVLLVAAAILVWRSRRAVPAGPS